MTRKKSNVKALALAVTCAILAGGGIGLKPVYADNVILDVKDGTIATGSVSGTITGKVDSEDITNGYITGGNLTGGTFTGTVTLTGDNIKTAIDGVDISKAKVTAESGDGTIGGLAYNVNTNKTNIGNLQNAVGNTSNPGSLLHKTQKISYDATTGTTVDGVVLKDKGISAVDGKFAVKVDEHGNAETVVSGAGGTTTIYGGGITIESVDDAKGHVLINGGGIAASVSVLSPVITDGDSLRMASGNVVAKNGLYIGDTNILNPTKDNSKFSVDGTNGDTDLKGKLDVGGAATLANTLSVKGATTLESALEVKGNTTVGGDLTVAGAATFAKETTFGDGIKTDTISEKNDGKGVTVDGVLLKDKGISAADGNFTVNGVTGDVTTKGALKGKTLGIGTNGNEFTVDQDGNTNVGGTLGVTGATTLENTLDVKGATILGSTLAVTGNTTVGGTLGVTGKTTLQDELQVYKKATFGSAASANTVIEGDVVETGRIETSKTQASNIGGVQLLDGQITADGMTIKGTIDLENLKVNDTLTVGINTKITDGTLQFGTADDKKLTADKLANINQTIKANRVIDATSATIDGVEINGGNVTTATGTIKGNTITDGNGFMVTGGKITAKEGQIGSVVISAAGVNVNGEIKASAFKVGDGNYLDGNGITATGGHIGGAVIDAKTLTVGVTKLDTAEGITTNQLKINGMTLTDTKLDTGNATFEVNGVEFKQGQVTAMYDKGFVAGTSSFKQGSLIVDANNKLEATNGLTTEKATVKGNLDVTGKATFGTDANNQTTIEGKTVTTDTLKANKLILGASGDPTVQVDQDGSLKAADGKFEVDKDGALKAADGAFTVAKDGKTIFKKDDNNLSSINGGNIWAKATDAANSTSSVLLHDSTGLHVKGNQSSQESAFDFDAATGVSTFTGQNKTTTTVNGSAITSTKATDDTGVLDGSNLTLKKGDNKTELTAGGVTFTGKKGASAQEGNITTINGGIITTDTLNVQRIELGEKLVDKNGDDLGSNLSMDNQGNFTAAGGNFTVIGGSDANKGAMTNTVGNTTLKTDTTGASMSYVNGDVTSNVSVGDNKANVSAGAGSIDVTNESITSKVTDNATSTITQDSIVDKVGNNSVTTDDKGTTFANGGTKTTNINGGTITTGKLITDELVITGKGDAAGPGTGSLAFGGNGTIKSDVKEDGSTNNTQFTTDINGVNTMVTDGTTTTENQVTAAGNSNTVKQDDKHKSEFNQDLTSIGGVVTNGEIKVAQYLDGKTGLLTNEVTDANGSSKLEQSGTGLTYTDSANTGNATRINSSDVSIGSATSDKDRINLSDLGQIDELDKEIRDNEVYKKNETAVGGINAEAAIRREEVARLDGRINDVNDRVNKVGAMAAAIASLKSIGYDPQAPSEFSIGLGQYKGETGVAMGFFHYPNKNFMINVSLSTAGGETMGGIGATWRFGHKSPQKLLEEQREAQAKKELAAAEKYQAAAKLAKEAQERAEYAAKLARQAQVSADNAKAAADATQAKHFG